MLIGTCSSSRRRRTGFITPPTPPQTTFSFANSRQSSKCAIANLVSPHTKQSLDKQLLVVEGVGNGWLKAGVTVYTDEWQTRSSSHFIAYKSLFISPRWSYFDQAVLLSLLHFLYLYKLRLLLLRRISSQRNEFFCSSSVAYESLFKWIFIHFSVLDSFLPV